MDNVKKAKVIMLPTNNKTNLWISTQTNIFRYSSACIDDMRLANSYHLYIISDDEIKEGDWVICNGSKNTIQKIIEINEHNELELSKGYCLPKILCKKIIATTDILFAPTDDMINPYLPQPSQQFIEKYIESYNKGEVITDVLVEYETISKPVHDYPLNVIKQLKVNPKNNTITIKKVKDNWNREEVFALITTFNKANIDTPNVVKWIEENL